MTRKVTGVKARIDGRGRIVLPASLRAALGLLPGTTLDISRYGEGLHLVPTGGAARLVDEAGVLVATGGTVVDDDMVRGLREAGRR